MDTGVNFWVLVHFLESNQAQVPGRSGEVRSHLPFTRRFLVPNSCHLDVGWGSGNQWAGRRCVKPHGRGFGCYRVTPELVCYLPILITFGSDGLPGDHARPPGLRQGTTVCVHTSMDMEHQSDHKLITPSGMGLFVCGAGSHPSCHPVVQDGTCQRGVNLNQYPGPGSHIRWHSDSDPLFKPQNFPELNVSLSLGNSVEFMVRRRASGDVPSSIRLGHGDVLVMDGLAQSEYEHCTASGLQGPRVNLTYRWVAQHTASCPLAGVVGCVFPTCAQGSVEPGSRGLGEGENKWSSSWGLVLLLSILVPSGRHFDLH